MSVPHDPWHGIVDVKWGDAAVEFSPPAYLLQSRSIIADCSSLVASVWFRVPANAPDGQYPIVVFGNRASGPSFINVQVDGGAGLVSCSFSGPNISDSGVVPTFDYVGGYDATGPATEGDPNPPPYVPCGGNSCGQFWGALCSAGVGGGAGGGDWNLAPAGGCGDGESPVVLAQGLSMTANATISRGQWHHIFVTVDVGTDNPWAFFDDGDGRHAGVAKFWFFIDGINARWNMANSICRAN